MEGSPPAIDSTIALIVALSGLLATVLVPIVLALINRGGKAQPVALDPTVVIPRAEYDRLVDRLADVDDELHRSHREAESARARADLWQERAVIAGWTP